MQQQLNAWQGEFGTEYTGRNVIDWRERLPGFREMMGNLSLRRVLEVGCNRGHNLQALHELLGVGCELVGLEPNAQARAIAAATVPSSKIVEGTAYQLPFPVDHFDLVFTAGVLIHIPLADLPTALDEVGRCSGRYILACEYFAKEETVIPYRGHTQLLWKRDFLKHYLSRFSNLRLIRSGTFERDSCWDESTWWLLEKAAPAESRL